MDNSNDNNKTIVKVLAWIALVVITIFLFVIVYALVKGNGKLALAFIVGLIFLSIIIWVGLKLYKDVKKYRKSKGNL